MNARKKPGKSALKRMFGERFRAGSYATFASAIVVAIAVMVNLFVSSLPSSATQFDLTSNSIYSLSAQTKQIAAMLDKDVTLYLLASSGSEDSSVQRLLNLYAGLSGHIRVEAVDPAAKPTFLDNYDLDTSRLYQNSVIVQCGDRYRLVSYNDIYVTEYSMDYYSYNYTSTTTFQGENALTNAIHYVSSDTLPKVYVVSGHGETELDERITSMLKQDNFDYETISLLSLEAIPEDASALVINAPTSDLSEDEAALLTEYLSGGGNVVLMTGYIAAGEMTNLLKVTSAMGLTAEEGIVIEGDRNMRLARYPHYLLPTIGEHNITSALSGIGYFILAPLAQPIAEVDGTSAQITWLLTTSDSSYAKQKALQMTTTEKEDGDTDGPFHVGAVSELSGKLFWITSDAMLNNNVDNAVSGANSDLFMNALNWMSGQEDSISIRAKSMDRVTLTVPQSSATMWTIIMIGVIPAVLVGTGVIIVIRRKRR